MPIARFAAENVGRPAGREGHDQGEGFGGEGLLGPCRRKGGPGKGQCRQSADWPRDA